MKLIQLPSCFIANLYLYLRLSIFLVKSHIAGNDFTLSNVQNNIKLGNLCLNNNVLKTTVESRYVHRHKMHATFLKKLSHYVRQHKMSATNNDENDAQSQLVMKKDLKKLLNKHKHITNQISHVHGNNIYTN